MPSVPSLYRGTFEIMEEPKDTFLHMKSWTKGVCFINGHNLGRYWNIGPQETLYLPAPWLNKGHNEVCLYFKLNSPLHNVQKLLLNVIEHSYNIRSPPQAPVLFSLLDSRGSISALKKVIAPQGEIGYF